MRPSTAGECAAARAGRASRSNAPLPAARAPWLFLASASPVRRRAPRFSSLQQPTQRGPPSWVQPGSRPRFHSVWAAFQYPPRERWGPEGQHQPEIQKPIVQRVTLLPEASEPLGEAPGTPLWGPKHPLHSSQRRGSPNIVAPGPTRNDRAPRQGSQEPPGAAQTTHQPPRKVAARATG